MKPPSYDQKNKNKNSLSRSDRQALVVALDEIHVVAGPVVHLEVRTKREQQRFAGAVKMVAHLQRARRQRAEHLWHKRETHTFFSHRCRKHAKKNAPPPVTHVVLRVFDD